MFPSEPRGKRPVGALAPRGFQDATDDESQIERWWLREPEANIGIATGAASGFLAIDIDAQHSELESWTEAACWTAITVLPAEWGHNPLPWPDRDEWPGPTCYCGRTGCIETFLSGPGLARAYHRRTAQVVEASEIVRRAKDGEAAADQALAKYEHRMARALGIPVFVIGYTR